MVDKERIVKHLDNYCENILNGDEFKNKPCTPIIKNLFNLLRNNITDGKFDLNEGESINDR